MSPQNQPSGVDSIKRVPLKDSSKNFTNVNKSPINHEEADQQLKKSIMVSNRSRQPVQVTHTKKRHSAGNRMIGRQLRQWQLSWRRIMNVSVVYFEENSRRHDRENARATAAFKNLGASIAKFFSDAVTIIISMRPYDKHGEYPEGDIFRVARKKELKVWNYDKVFRFMRHLGEPIPDDQPTRKLSSLLQNEKLFGPNDRDPKAHRDDVKYFTNLYIYVYDLRQQMRPIAIREWGRNNDYPKLCKSTNGRSLFVEDSHSHSRSSVAKRHSRRMLYLNETKDYRSKLIEASYVDTDEEPPTYEERVSFQKQWERNFYGVERISTEDSTNDENDSSKSEEEATIEKLKLKLKEIDKLIPDQNISKQEHLKLQEIESEREKEKKARLELDKKIINEEKSNMKFGGDLQESNIPILNPPELEQIIPHEKESEAYRQLLAIEHGRIRTSEGTVELPCMLRHEDSALGISGTRFKNEYGEIQASGVQNLSGSTTVSGNNFGNGLAPSYSLVSNKKIANDKKKTFIFGTTLPSSKLTARLPLSKQIMIPTSTTKNMEKENNVPGVLKPINEISKKVPPELVTKHAELAKPNHFASAEATERKLKRKREIRAAERKKKAKHQSKPGYCENCRVKYADFEEHIMSDKHRQFAINESNFRKIDDLIDTVRMTRIMGL